MKEQEHETLQYPPPSRSEQRRQALDVLALAGQLLELAPGRLKQLPIPESLHAHIASARRITSHIARKRQLAFVAKQMRREEERVLDGIRAALDHGSEAARQDSAFLHRIEHWRERLLAEGDTALAGFLAMYPAAERQHLRQLIRQAQTERQHDKPPRAFRELFQCLRQIMEQEPISNREIQELIPLLSS